MVSIVLVTYNRAKRLRLSIQDILNQSFTEFELIICDDCSTDDTEKICLDFAAKDSRIKYFGHKSNLRMPANCNFGIQQSRYDYVAILHDGDRFRKDLIAQWYAALSQNESVGFVFNSIGVADGEDKLLSEYKEFPEGVVNKDYLLKEVFFRRWRFDSPVFGEAMVKKSLLKEKGLLKDTYGFYADVDFWMEVLHTHNAYYCADTLITGPSKDYQPQLFNYGMIKTFKFLYSMHFYHRKKAFADQPFRKLKELIFFSIQGFFCLNYTLLLLIKNYSFGAFIGAASALKSNILFLISWLALLVFYPIIFPLLKLFDAIKWLFKGGSRPSEQTAQFSEANPSSR